MMLDVRHAPRAIDRGCRSLTLFVRFGFILPTTLVSPCSGDVNIKSLLWINPTLPPESLKLITKL